MLMAPALVILSMSGVAHADCTVTAGTGTVASPDNGDTITCTTGAPNPYTNTIGDSTEGNAATVDLQAGAQIDVTDIGINIDDVTVTLGAGSSITTSTITNRDGIYSRDNTDNLTVDITLGANSSINTSTIFSEAIHSQASAAGAQNDTTVRLSGTNALISTTADQSTGIRVYSSYSDANAIVELSGDGSQISTTGFRSYGIYSDSDGGVANATVTLSGNNAEINTTNNSAVGVYSYGDTAGNANVTLSGDNTKIETAGTNSEGVRAETYDGTADATVTLSGTSAEIITAGNFSDGVRSYSYNGLGYADVTLSGTNSRIYTSGDTAHGVLAYGYNDDATAVVTLSGTNARIETAGMSSDGIRSYSYYYDSDATITLDSGTSVISAQAVGINVSSQYLTGHGTTTIDNSGLIQGGTNSISLADGNDNVTLRTGSNLSSPIGANFGAGNDTLTLDGNGNEDEVFFNVETVQVNADATGWGLSGNSTFDDINVNTGLFSNNGFISVNNALTVSAGATFGGTGTLIGDVTNNGTINAGNSVGTQIITGNFVQGAGGTLDVEFDGSGVDLIDITGTATLDGTVRFIELSAGVTEDTPLTFLEADGGIAGTFSTETNVFLMGTTLTSATVNIGATAATVTFTGGSTVDFSEVGDQDSGSAGEVGTVIDNLVTADPAAATNIINAINASDDVGNALASQSGIVVSSSVSSAASALEQVSNIVRGRITPPPSSSFSPFSSPNGVSASADSVAQINPAAGYEGSFHKRDTRTYWAEAVGGFGDVDGSSKARGVEYDTYGLAAGAEASGDIEDIIIGLFGSFTETESEVDGLDDEGLVNSYQIGIYGSKQLDNALQLSASLSASYLDFETDRETSQGTANADFDGAGLFLYGEALYDAGTYNNIEISPYAAFEGAWIYHEGYTENGAGALNLKVDSQGSGQIKTQLGAEFKTSYWTDQLLITPRFRAGWAYDITNKDTEVDARFANSSVSSFTSEGPDRNANSAKIHADIALQSLEQHNITFNLSYDGELASDAQDHLFTSRIGMKW